MSLLVPETGLLFWMTLSFATVLLVLARYAFPVILRGMAERRQRIHDALEAAKQAEARMADMDVEAQAILEKARKERTVLLQEAQDMRTALLEKAARDAEIQAAARLKRAGVEIEELRRRTMDEAMAQIAGLSVKIAEKVMGEKLAGGDEQLHYIDRLLKEQTTEKNG